MVATLQWLFTAGLAHPAGIALKRAVLKAAPLKPAILKRAAVLRDGALTPKCCTL